MGSLLGGEVTIEVTGGIGDWVRNWVTDGGSNGVTNGIDDGVMNKVTGGVSNEATSPPRVGQLNGLCVKH